MYDVQELNETIARCNRDIHTLEPGSSKFEVCLAELECATEDLEAHYESIKPRAHDADIATVTAELANQ